MLRAIAIHCHPSILHQSRDIKSASLFKTITVFSLVGVSVCGGGSKLGSYNLTSSGVGALILPVLPVQVLGSRWGDGLLVGS